MLWRVMKGFLHRGITVAWTLTDIISSKYPIGLHDWWTEKYSDFIFFPQSIHLQLRRARQQGQMGATVHRRRTQATDNQNLWKGQKVMFWSIQFQDWLHKNIKSYNKNYFVWCVCLLGDNLARERCGRKMRLLLWNGTWCPSSHHARFLGKATVIST